MKLFPQKKPSSKTISDGEDRIDHASPNTEIARPSAMTQANQSPFGPSDEIDFVQMSTPRSRTRKLSAPFRNISATTGRNITVRHVPELRRTTRTAMMSWTWSLRASTLRSTSATLFASEATKRTHGTNTCRTWADSTPIYPKRTRTGSEGETHCESHVLRTKTIMTKRSYRVNSIISVT